MVLPFHADFGGEGRAVITELEGRPFLASLLKTLEHRMAIRLDKLVAERFSLSRRTAQEAVLNGRVDLEGEVCEEPGRLVEPAASVLYDPNRPKVRKVRTKLVVLYEDRDVIIVDKPAGVLTLPTANHESNTLLERVTKYLSVRHGGGSHYVGVLHRLDKDTSGALAMAKNAKALKVFQALFKSHEIERQYLAVVEGKVVRDQGTIDLPLVADRGDLRRGVARNPGEGKTAVTHYRVLERYGGAATLLACWLETGRTHQIRIHMSAIGHPVVGDAVYRPREHVKGRIKHDRQVLHAQTLGFVHPRTGLTIRTESPPPEDLEKLITGLRGRFGENLPTRTRV